MTFYVYILQSVLDGTFYKGFSEDPKRRLEQHNAGEGTFTSAKRPWVLVYVEQHSEKRSALIREKNLKKATRERILGLIQSPKNIVGQFI